MSSAEGLRGIATIAVDGELYIKTVVTCDSCGAVITINSDVTLAANDDPDE